MCIILYKLKTAFTRFFLEGGAEMIACPGAPLTLATPLFYWRVTENSIFELSIIRTIFGRYKATSRRLIIFKHALFLGDVINFHLVTSALHERLICLKFPDEFCNNKSDKIFQGKLLKYSSRMKELMVQTYICHIKITYDISYKHDMCI